MIFDGKYLLGEVSGGANHENWLQMGPGGGQGGPRVGARGPKEGPRRAHGGQKGSPNHPRRAQGRQNLSFGSDFLDMFDEQLIKISAKRMKT